MQKRITQDERGCWVWEGAVSTAGYGMVSIGNRAWAVHRIMYYMYYGKVGPERELHHKCRNKLCCNPEHLEEVTDEEHLERHPDNQGRKDVCIYGHVMDEGNTYIKPDGHRTCRACNAARVRAWYKRNGKKHRKRGVVVDL